MWDLALSRPRWTRSVQKASLVATVLFVASFLCSILLPTIALAVDATWSGQNLSYDGKTFVKSADIKAGDKRNPIEGTHVYEYTDNQTKTLEVLYIDKGTPDVTKATMAQYVIYKNFTPPDTFSEMSSPQTVTITGSASAGTKAGTSTCDSSIFEGLGWVLCPLSNLLAKAVDNIYGIISSFLVVTTLTTDQNNSIFKIWQIIVSLANMCFIFAFLYIVYLHLVSVNIEKYHLLKKALPRMLIAAILVNISYWVCALAVDISNLLGYSVERLFAGVRESVGLSVHIDWSAITSFILSAGAVGSLVGFAAATGGSLISAGFLLISMLISVILAAMVAFIILAARQALIVIFIIVSPLAFVAWTLPNTEKYFKRWLDTFITLLMLFPIFSALFGGSMLAGAAIMNSANGNLVIALIGMAVQVVPLALTPLIIKFSTGLLGQIANITNNQKRGLADRTRNWAQDNSKHHRLRKLSKNDNMVGRNPILLGNPSRLARSMDRSRRRREMMDKDNEDLLGNRASYDYQNRTVNARRGQYSRMRQRRMDSHEMHERASLRQSELDEQANAHWQHVSRTYSPIVAERLGALAAEDEAKREKATTEKVYTEVKALGDESQLVKDLQGRIPDAQYNGILQVARNVKTDNLETYVEETAQRMAERSMAQERASVLKDVSASSEAIRVRAAGILKGKGGEQSVRAQARRESSKFLVDDIENIQGTLDNNLATDTDWLQKQLTENTELKFSERIAYSNLLAKAGGPGTAALKRVISRYDRMTADNIVREPAKAAEYIEDLQDYKDFMRNNSQFMGLGKDLEFWATNLGPQDANGNPVRDSNGRAEIFDFDEITKRKQTWNNISARNLTSLNVSSQFRALNVLYHEDREAYDSLVAGLEANDGMLMGELKTSIRKKIRDVEAGRETWSPVPTARPYDDPTLPDVR